MDRVAQAETIPLSPTFRAVGHVALLFGALLAGSFGGYMLADGAPPGFADKDFANYWVSARLAAEGRVDLIFGPNEPYLAHLRTLMGPEFPWHNWSYPPHYLLMMMPLALVGYKAGALLFLAATGLFFAFAVRTFASARAGLMLAAIGPLAVVNVWTVQNGFLTSGLMLWTLALREKRPVLAGLCLGALSIKPQLALLLPLLMLVERRWAVLLAAAGATAALVLASLAAFGPSAWAGYLGTVVPYQTRVMMEFGGTFLTMMPSGFGGARLQGMAAVPALHLHIAFAVVVGLFTLASLVVVRDAWRRAAILLVATFLVTPYALNYDLGCLGAALALFVAREEQEGRPFGVGQHLLLGFAMLLPFTMMLLGRVSIPVAPFALAGVFGLMLSRAGFIPAAADRLRIA